jgi:hypothetical protein
MDYPGNDAIVNSGQVEYGLSEAEQGLSDEFMELVRAGARPDLEQYLRRLPGSRARLRPILEGALLFGGEVERFKREHPGTSIFEWLCRGEKGTKGERERGT